MFFAKKLLSLSQKWQPVNTSLQAILLTNNLGKQAARYLIFLPSLLTGLIGAIWLLIRPLNLAATAGPLTILLTAVLLVLALLGGAWLLERFSPSFRFASKLLERALEYFPMSIPLALSLAAVTAVAEELFFRGALLPLIGVWGQALLFGLMHPVPRKGWAYMVYSFVAGLSFGYATLYTGSLWAATVAHFAINLQGFLEVRALQKRKRQVMASNTDSPS